jgi:hypothetical protein
MTLIGSGTFLSKLGFYLHDSSKVSLENKNLIFHCCDDPQCLAVEKNCRSCALFPAMFLTFFPTGTTLGSPFANTRGTVQICSKYEGVHSCICTCDHDQFDISLSGVRQFISISDRRDKTQCSIA